MKSGERKRFECEDEAFMRNLFGQLDLYDLPDLNLRNPQRPQDVQQLSTSPHLLKTLKI